MYSTPDNAATLVSAQTIWMLLTAIVALAALASTLEHLGQPCRTNKVSVGRVVTDRATGRELLVLTNTNEATGAELIFLDFERDTSSVYRAPAGAGSHALLEVPGERLMVGTFYDGKFMVFDLRAMEFIEVADFPGEDYVWNLALGSDGRVYGGTYPGARLGALDLDTYAVEDCGAPVLPNMYLQSVSATPEGRILCSFGIQTPATRLFDPATKRFHRVPKQLEGLTRGVSWKGYFAAGSRVCRGASLDLVEPPFPVPSADRGEWSVDTNLTTDNALFLRQNNALYRYAPGDTALTLVAVRDLRGGSLLASTREGTVLGVRGQDYFVIKPGDKDLILKPIPAELHPRPTLFLKADDRGRLWGGPLFGQTLFWVDTRTKRVTNTPNICDISGEVYDVAFVGGKVYAASYCGGDITRYDPDQPWDQWNHNNPRPVAKVGPAYVRPTGGIVLGAEGKLYSGWMARYGTYGGAVAITDPATGATELIENPLGEQAVEGLAVDERFAYIGTSLAANGLPDKPGESARFGVVEIASRQVVFEHTFEGASGVRAVVYDPQTRRAAMAADGRLWVFDAASLRLAHDPFASAPQVNSRTMAAPGDGKVYYGSSQTIVAVDLKSGEAARIVETPPDITNVTVAPDGSLYFSCGVDVYRVVR